jgi:hypothetical protein
MPNEHLPKADSDPALDNFEDLVSFARDYFSADFPNVARIECPASEQIERIIKSGRLPPDRLREHVLSCSNCFRFYQQTLAAREKACVTAPSAWRQFLFSLRQARFAMAAVILIVIVSSVAIIYVRRGRQRGSVVANDAATASPTKSAPELPRNLSSQGGNNSVEIHFNSYHLRGDDKNGEASTEASRSKTEFVITLPQGSPVGQYSVSVVDALGSTVKNTFARSHDGKMLVVEIDLSKLPQQKYRLCVSRPAESPNCGLITLK